LLVPDDPVRLGILPDLGDSLFEAGEAERAREVFDEATERVAAAGDERLRLHTLIARHWTMADSKDPEGLARDAITVFEAAGDERGLARAHAIISNLRFMEGRMGEAERALEQALAHARAANDVREEADIYGQLGTMFARGATPIGEAVRRCREILAQTEGNRTIAAGMYHALGHLLARRGEFEEALDVAARCREIYRENGSLWSYWFFAEILWDIEMLADRPAEALAILSEAYEELEAIGETFRLLLVFLAQSLCELGRFDEAEARARAAVDSDSELARHAGMGVLARVLAHRGHFQEAEAMAREAVAHFEGTEFSADRTGVLLDLAEVCRLAGRPEEAVATLRQALELFDQREDIVSAARTRELIEELATNRK
jgi:tetratricopeptide (TPR) repeat protein